MIPTILIAALLAQFPPQTISVTIDPHLAQLTAADGTSCTLDRTPGSSVPSLTLTCLTSGFLGDVQSYTMQPPLNPSGFYAQIGDVVCWVLIDTSPAPIAGTFFQALGGTFGTDTPFTLQAPGNGAAWSCTTNIWSGGVVTSQTPAVTGSAVWP
jgi:hypothetical protein